MSQETRNAVELDDLYQEIILDHFKNPRNARPLTDDEVVVDEENPTCGDQIKLFAKVEDGKVVDVKYEARGCAISTASASMMSELAMGRSIDEVRELTTSFSAMMRGEKPFEGDGFDDLIALEGVKRYPLRIKCATMCWHALNSALDQLKA